MTTPSHPATPSRRLSSMEAKVYNLGRTPPPPAPRLRELLDASLGSIADSEVPAFDEATGRWVPERVMLSARRFGALPLGPDEDMSGPLQDFADALEGRIGWLPEGVYGQFEEVVWPSNFALIAHQAWLVAPEGSAFNMFSVTGSSGDRKSDVFVYGLSLDMRSDELALSGANGFFFKFVDRYALVDCRADNCGFEGFLLSWSTDFWLSRPQARGCWGDSIHMGISEVDEVVRHWIIDTPVIEGRGFESGVATTGDLVDFGSVIAPHVRLHDRGMAYSGGHDFTVIGGLIEQCRIGTTLERVDYGGGVTDSTYDVDIVGTKYRDLAVQESAGPVLGIQIATANFEFDDRPIRLRGVDIEAPSDGACIIIGSAGQVDVYDSTLRTDGGYCMSLEGTSERPGGRTRVFRTDFIGGQFGVAGNAAAFSGTFEGYDNTFTDVDNPASDESWPSVWQGPPREYVFFKGGAIATNVASAELDPSHRILGVPAFNRVRLRIYLDDAGGTGQPSAQLYDLTDAVVLQGLNFTSGTVGWVDLDDVSGYGPQIIEQITDFALHAGRTLAGTAPGLTVRGAVLVLG